MVGSLDIMRQAYNCLMGHPMIKIAHHSGEPQKGYHTKDIFWFLMVEKNPIFYGL